MRHLSAVAAAASYTSYVSRLIVSAASASFAAARLRRGTSFSSLPTLTLPAFPVLPSFRFPNIKMWTIPDVNEDISSDDSRCAHEELASACIALTPEWASIPPENLNVATLTGGLSNKLYMCTLKDALPNTEASDDALRIVVLREFCASQGLVDREYEANVFSYLAEVGLGPLVYGQNERFRTEQFLDGTSLSVSEYASARQLQITAKLLAQFHQLQPPAPLAARPSTLFDLIDRSVDSAMQSQAGQQDLALVSQCKRVFDRDVRPALLALQSPVLLCHNDAQEGNILRMKSGRKYVLIDYEYMSWNYRGYDLANVLCETIIDNAASTSTGFEILEHQFPSPEMLSDMASTYLRAFHEEEDIAVEQVDALVQEMLKFQCASHIMWGSWALAKCGANEIEFGYREYGLARLALFEKEMHRFARGS